MDNHGRLVRCPVCGCRELFVRRDFPQRAGVLFVVVAAVTSIILFAAGSVLWAVLVLAGTAVIDAVVLLFVGRCLVCYRCRSEFRQLTIPTDQAGYDLSIGEKYRLPGSTGDGEETS